MRFRYITQRAVLMPNVFQPCVAFFPTIVVKSQIMKVYDLIHFNLPIGVTV